MKKKHVYYALFAICWLLLFWYCRNQYSPYTDADIQKSLADSILLDHSQIPPVDSTQNTDHGK